MRLEIQMTNKTDPAPSINSSGLYTPEMASHKRLSTIVRESKYRMMDRILPKGHSRRVRNARFQPSYLSAGVSILHAPLDGQARCCWRRSPCGESGPGPPWFGSGGLAVSAS
ncbi:MAG: hypothetical protein ABR550_00190 [Wenzhouxiangellaceae bacterium]